MLNATPAGMNVLAEQCATWSAGIAAAAVPQVAAAGHASAAAVSAIHAQVGLEAATFATRMGATAEKLTTAAGSYAAHDEASATQISSAATQVV